MICQTFCEVFFLRWLTGNLITDVISVWVKHSVYIILSCSNWFRVQESNLCLWLMRPSWDHLQSNPQFINIFQNFQLSPTNLILFSQIVKSVGHFFFKILILIVSRLSSHLFYKGTTKFSFSQIYFVKLYGGGVFVY